MTNYLALSERYQNFTQSYKRACDHMMQAAYMAYDFYTADGKKFRDYCVKALNISESTFSKLVKSGEIIKTNPGIDFTGMEYSKIYELKDVQGELENYSNYVAENTDKEFKDLSQREIKKTIKQFYNQGTEVEIEKDEHPATSTQPVNLWDELEDAIMEGLPSEGLLKIFYKLKKEVYNEE